MPHMNGRLWDVGMDSWEKEARPNAVIGADLEPSLEYYEISSKRDVGAMCPATQMWQERIQSIAKELFADYGVRALYIDQIAAASPALCFGESHGHEPGNGAYWVDGYHSMLREIRASAGEGPERSIITSEGTAEPIYRHLRQSSQLGSLPQGTTSRLVRPSTRATCRTTEARVHSTKGWRQ